MKHFKSNYILIFGILFILYSCTVTKNVTIKFKKVENEISFNENLKTFIKANKSPSIVLRIPGGASTMTSSQAGKGNQIYNTIENSLMKNGFTVRDRALFNEVVEKIDATDYSKIHALTNTDLIIELVSLNTKVKYSTNRYYDDGEDYIFNCNESFSFYGASLELRIILLRTNELVGNFKLNFAPCTYGCDYVYKHEKLNNYCYLINSEKNRISGQQFESIESSALEKFIERSIDIFIAELKD